MVDQGPFLQVNQCPSWAASLGYMGVAAAVCLSNWGSAVSHTAKSSFRIFFLRRRYPPDDSQNWILYDANSLTISFN
jgi:V-type H+-transporting ATPase proteolipid subunit